jgi:type IV secretion system protein TrbL
MACALWNPVGCAADVAKSAAGDAFSSIAHDFGQTADSAVNWLWAQTTDATAVHVGGTGFSLDIGIVATIAATVAVGLFVIQVATSTIRRDPSGLGRAAKGLVVAFIGAGVAIGTTNLLLAAVDSLSAGVVQAATGESLPQVGHAILAGSTLAAATSNPAAIIIFSLAALIAVAIVWAALTVRKVLIVISAVFAPLAFAGSLADITASWVRRWIEVTVALIVSKLILVIIFVVGLDMLVKGVGQAGSGRGQSATQAVSGLLVLALAGFAPWLALKLVHWSGDHFHQIHGLASTSAAGANMAVQAPQKAMPWVTSAGGGAGAGALGAAGSTGRGAGTAEVSSGSGGGGRASGGAGGRVLAGPIPSPPSGPGAAEAGDGLGAPGAAQPQPALAAANGYNRSGWPGQIAAGPESSPPLPTGGSSTPARATERNGDRNSQPGTGPAPAGPAQGVPPAGHRPAPAPPWPVSSKKERQDP